MPLPLDRQIRLFGIYPLACAIYECAVYLHPGGIDSFLNPRVFSGILFAQHESAFSIFCWASAIWLFCIAFALLTGFARVALILYPALELLLAGPTILWILFSLFGGMGHLTLSGRFLFAAVSMALVFSIVPVALSVMFIVRLVRTIS